MVLVLAVSGCGSDGKTGATSSVPVTTGPTPSPTPTPVATPTPTPAATRTYTYDRATDFTQDRKFTGYDRITVKLASEKALSTEFSSSETAVTSYATQGGKITLPDSTDLPGAGVYSAGDFTLKAGQRATYSAAGGTVSIGLPDILKAYEYFTFAIFKDSNIARLLVVGSPTDPKEIASAGTLTYLALINEESNDKGKATAQTLTIDTGAGTVSGTIPMLNSSDTTADYQLTGKIDANARVTGTLVSKDGATTGQFQGRLYGKGGKEIALLVSLKQTDGSFYATVLTGRLK
jgi:hypothetical protein